MGRSQTSSRQQKIADILAIVAGEVDPYTVRSKQPMLCIDWDDDPEDNDSWSIFMIGGKKVSKEQFNKELQWREENKKSQTC